MSLLFEKMKQSQPSEDDRMSRSLYENPETIRHHTLSPWPVNNKDLTGFTALPLNHTD